MAAVSSAGYRAVAPDMRGYGRSSAPADPGLYTSFHIVGDLVGLLDGLEIESAIIVGHDWGAVAAWAAAMMRPDRFKAVFSLTVPYIPRGEVSLFEHMRKTGHRDDFYMFEQCLPEAEKLWENSAVTIPGVLYWASGSAPDGTRWCPTVPAKNLYRMAPGPLPNWVDPEYVAYNIEEFRRTSFRGGLNYYRSLESSFDLSGAYLGAVISQPSFYMSGKLDGLNELYPLTDEEIKVPLPGLVGRVELENIGHWIQHEASNEVSEQVIRFASIVEAM